MKRSNTKTKINFEKNQADWFVKASTDKKQYFQCNIFKIAFSEINGGET